MFLSTLAVRGVSEAWSSTSICWLILSRGGGEDKKDLESKGAEFGIDLFRLFSVRSSHFAIAVILCFKMIMAAGYVRHVTPTTARLMG